MTTPLPVISMEQLKNVRDQSNALFQKCRIPFVRTAILLPKPEEPAVMKQHPIQALHIEQRNTPALYERITNGSKFQEMVNKMIRVDTPKLQQQIQLLLQEHQGDMPGDVIESIQLILKSYTVQFQRRLQMTLKTSFEDCIDVKAVQERAREVLSTTFKDGFIAYVMPALLGGLQTNPLYYRWVVGYFNDFLEQYGVYTQLYLPNQEIHYEMMIPEDKQLTDDPTLDGKIFDMLQLPYFFNDERYEGRALLCEGKCLAWRFEG